MPNNMKRAGKKYQMGGGQQPPVDPRVAMAAAGAAGAPQIPGIPPTAREAVGPAVGTPVMQDPGAPVSPEGVTPTAVPGVGPATPQTPPPNVLGAAAEMAGALGAKGRGGILSRGGQTKGSNVL